MPCLADACADGRTSCTAYYKFYTFVRPELLATGWSRDRMIEELRERGVACYSGSCSEIYLEEAFPTEWRPAERHPVAKGTW